MTSKQYIQSGMLESYCLGALDANGQQEVIQMCNAHPDVRIELNAIELAMEQVALSLAIAPNVGIRKSLLQSLFALDLDDLPITGTTSDLDLWLTALKHLIPAEHTQDFYHHLLKHNEQVTQSLVISKVNIPDETHDDLIESFFILEGSCKCVIDGKEYILNAGDFLEIPLHQHHDVVLLTPYVVAIHQQLALQAA